MDHGPAGAHEPVVPETPDVEAARPARVVPARAGRRIGARLQPRRAEPRGRQPARQPPRALGEPPVEARGHLDRAEAHRAIEPGRAHLDHRHAPRVHLVVERELDVGPEAHVVREELRLGREAPLVDGAVEVRALRDDGERGPQGIARVGPAHLRTEAAGLEVRRLIARARHEATERPERHVLEDRRAERDPVEGAERARRTAEATHGRAQVGPLAVRDLQLAHARPGARARARARVEIVGQPELRGQVGQERERHPVEGPRPHARPELPAPERPRRVVERHVHRAGRGDHEVEPGRTDRAASPERHGLRRLGGRGERRSGPGVPIGLGRRRRLARDRRGRLAALPDVRLAPGADAGRLALEREHGVAGGGAEHAEGASPDPHLDARAHAGALAGTHVHAVGGHVDDLDGHALVGGGAAALRVGRRGPHGQRPRTERPRAEGPRAERPRAERPRAERPRAEPRPRGGRGERGERPHRRIPPG
jgi:hypothetical protein